MMKGLTVFISYPDLLLAWAAYCLMREVAQLQVFCPLVSVIASNSNDQSSMQFSVPYIPLHAVSAAWGEAQAVQITITVTGSWARYHFFERSFCALTRIWVLLFEMLLCSNISSLCCITSNGPVFISEVSSLCSLLFAFFCLSSRMYLTCLLASWLAVKSALLH